MATRLNKIVGASALGAISIVELLHLQQASATPVTFTGSTYANPHGGNVQVAITVDGAGGTYRITGISTPVQPTGQNSSYASYAIPTLTSEALAAQSAAINGVSGASQISAAWTASLSSAIAAAAAGGETIGQASVAAAPTPTPSAGTPTPGGTTPAPSATATQSSITPPGPVTSPGGVVVPYFAPLSFQPFTVATIPNFTVYSSQIAAALSSLSKVQPDSGASSLTAARSTLTTLQVQVQSESNQYQGMPSNLSGYVSMLNSEFAALVSQANLAISNYYASVQAAASKMYTEVQASAAAVKAIPAPTVTVTVTATATATAAPTTPAFIIKPGGVIKKTFTCVQKVGAKTTTKIVKGFIMSCPTGFTLLKK